MQLDGQKRICVPKTKTKEILKKVHDDELHGGHFGIYNTFLKAATISYWPHQFKDVSRYVKRDLSDVSDNEARPGYKWVAITRSHLLLNVGKSSGSTLF